MHPHHTAPALGRCLTGVTPWIPTVRRHGEVSGPHSVFGPDRAGVSEERRPKGRRSPYDVAMTISGQGKPLIRVLHDESRRDLREPDRPRPVRLYLWEPCRPA